MAAKNGFEAQILQNVRLNSSQLLNTHVMRDTTSMVMRTEHVKSTRNGQEVNQSAKVLHLCSI